MNNITKFNMNNITKFNMNNIIKFNIENAIKEIENAIKGFNIENDIKEIENAIKGFNIENAIKKIENAIKRFNIENAIKEFNMNNLKEFNMNGFDGQMLLLILKSFNIGLDDKDMEFILKSKNKDIYGNSAFLTFLGFHKNYKVLIQCIKVDESLKYSRNYQRKTILMKVTVLNNIEHSYNFIEMCIKENINIKDIINEVDVFSENLLFYLPCLVKDDKTFELFKKLFDMLFKLNINIFHVNNRGYNFMEAAYHKQKINRNKCLSEISKFINYTYPNVNFNKDDCTKLYKVIETKNNKLTEKIEYIKTTYPTDIIAKAVSKYLDNEIENENKNLEKISEFIKEKYPEFSTRKNVNNFLNMKSFSTQYIKYNFKKFVTSYIGYKNKFGLNLLMQLVSVECTHILDELLVKNTYKDIIQIIYNTNNNIFNERDNNNASLLSHINPLKFEKTLETLTIIDKNIVKLLSETTDNYGGTILHNIVDFKKSKYNNIDDNTCVITHTFLDYPTLNKMVTCLLDKYKIDVNVKNHNNKYPCNVFYNNYIQKINTTPDEIIKRPSNPEEYLKLLELIKVETNINININQINNNIEVSSNLIDLYNLYIDEYKDTHEYHKEYNNIARVYTDLKKSQTLLYTQAK